MSTNNEGVDVAEELVVEAPKATIFFGRKVSDGNYGSTEVGIHFPVDLTDDEAENDARLAHIFAITKGTVYTQLGVDFTIDSGVVVEKLGAAFPNSTEVAPAAPAAPSAPAAAATGGPAHPVFGSCKGCGGNQFWDNRSTKTGRQPDGKCKDRACAKGVWLGDSK